MNELKRNTKIYKSGCFTLEYFIRGMSLKQIWAELGLQPGRLAKGAYLAWAHEGVLSAKFELAGWAEHSTDNFIDFDKKGKPWSLKDYNKTLFPGSKLTKNDLNIFSNGWKDSIKNEKLIKVIPADTSYSEEKYPKGKLAGQIYFRDSLPCKVIKHYKPNDIFRNVWD